MLQSQRSVKLVNAFWTGNIAWYNVHLIKLVVIDYLRQYPRYIPDSSPKRTGICSVLLWTCIFPLLIKLEKELFQLWFHLLWEPIKRISRDYGIPVISALEHWVIIITVDTEYLNTYDMHCALYIDQLITQTHFIDLVVLAMYVTCILTNKAYWLIDIDWLISKKYNGTCTLIMS